MRYSDQTVRAVLAARREGVSVAEVSSKHEVSPATVHRWRAQARHVPDPERSYAALAEENRRLKHLVGELTLENRELRATVKRPGVDAR